MYRAIAGVAILWAVTGYAIFHTLTTEPSTREIQDTVTLSSPPELGTRALPITEHQLAVLLYVPTELPPEPDITVARDIECEINDGQGHCWKWGAWRNPDDSAWEPPTQNPPATYSAPTYSAPASTASTAAPDGSLLAQCGRDYPAGVHRWAPVAAQYSWDVCAWANIVDCESDGDEWVMNYSGSGACGVMQHLPCQYLGDGAGSIALGYAKYAERGWQPWTVGGCYPY